jgi:acetoin utilization deacetylase AcuC-like enzyme
MDGELAAGVMLGGGGHHVKFDVADGLAWYNDVAIAIREVQRRFGQKRILVFDWDVHHGDTVCLLGFHGLFCSSLHSSPPPTHTLTTTRPHH